MGAFKSAVITNKGQALIAKSMLGTAKLEFTKIAVSENTLTGDLASKTGIGTLKQSVKVASVLRTSDASVKVSASISNENLTSGYYIRNIGLYAKDPDEGEILYSISVADESIATADWMPPFNGVGVSSLMMDLITVVSNADNVKVEVDPTASATVAQINILQSQIEELTPSKIAVGTAIGVNDSAELPLINLKVLGKTEQVVTTGAQMLDDTTLRGYTVVSDTAMYVDGVLKAGNIFPVLMFTDGTKGTAVGVSLTAIMADGTGKDYFFNMANEVTAEDVANFQGKYKIYFNASYAGKTVEYLMLNAGTEALPCEPYSGNKPAPSIEYPQELASVGGNGSIDVEVIGKNIIPPKPTGTYNYNGVTRTIHADGSITVNGTATGDAIFHLSDVVLKPNTDYIISGCPNGGEDTSYYCSVTTLPNFRVTVRDIGGGVKFNSGKDTSWNVRIVIKNGVTVNNLTFYPMLRIAGSSDGSYEPYKSKLLTVSTPNGLPSIPVTDKAIATYTDESGKMWVADEIDFERGVYIKRIYEYTLQSEDVTNVDNSNASAGGTVAGIVLPVPYYTVPNPNTVCVMSDQAMGVSYYDRGKDVSVYRIYTSETSRASVTFRYPNSVGAVTLEQAKADIAGMKIQYILETPIETALTAEEIEAYTALNTNYPNTSILNTANAPMSVEYVKKAYNRALGNLVNRFSKGGMMATDISEDFIVNSSYMGATYIDAYIQGNVIYGTMTINVSADLDGDVACYLQINSKYKPLKSVYCPLMDKSITLDSDFVTIHDDRIDYGEVNSTVGSAKITFTYICK